MTDSPNDSPAASVAHLSQRSFWALSASYGLGMVQFWMTIPLAAVVLAERGVEAWLIGLIGAAPWAVLMALLPFVPRLVVVWGAVRVFRAGLWVGLAGAAAFVVSDALWVWVAAYALCGAGLALRWIVGDGMVAAMAPPDRRGHFVGVFETMVGATMAAGPMVLVVVGAEDGRAFLIGLALIALALPPSFLIRLPDDRGGAKRLGSATELLRAVFRAPAAVVAALACGVIEGAATKLFPVQAIGLGYGETWAAATVTAFGAGNLLTQYPAGRLCDMMDLRRLTGGAFAALAVLAALVPAAAGHPVAYLVALGLAGGVAGSLYTLAVIDAGRTGSALQAMAVIAGVSVAYTGGSVLGPVLAGAATSASVLFGVPAVIVTVSLLSLAAVRRWR